MPAAAARTIITKLGFRVEDGKLRGFQAGVDQAKVKMGQLRRAQWKASREFDKFATAAKAAVVGVATGFAVKALTVDFAHLAVETDRMSKSLGVTTDFFGGFRHALGTIGIEGDETAQMIADISERMFDAANGSKALADDFGQIGLTRSQLKDLAEAGPEKQILALADAMKAAGPGAKRTFTAMSGLGDVGARMLPLLEQGSEGLQRMLLDAKRLGVTLDKDAIKNAKEFNASVNVMKAQLLGLRNELAAKLLPPLTKIIKAFSQWAKDGDNVDRMLRRLTIALKALIPLLLILVGKKIILGLAALKVQLVGIAAAVRLLASQFAYLLIPLIPIIIKLTLLILLVDEIRTLVAGGDSLFGRLIGNDSELVDALRFAFEDLGRAFKEAWAELRPLVVELVKAIGPLIAQLWAAIRPFIPNLKTILVLLIKAFVFVLIVAIRLLTVIVRIFVKILNVAIVPILKLLGKAFGWALRGILKLVSKIGRVFQFLWRGNIKGAGDELRIFGQIFDWIKDKAMAVANFIGNAFRMAWRKMAETFPEETKLLVRFFEILGAFAATVWKLMEKLGKAAADVIMKAWAPLLEVVDKVASTLDAVTGGAVDKAATFLGLGGVVATDAAAVEARMKELERAATGSPPEAGNGAAAAAAASKQGDRTVNVGNVAVNVSGSVDMSSDEAKAKIKAASKEAMQEAFSEVMKDRKPATTTAGAQ